MTEPVQVFRLKIRRGSSSSSWPDWTLYEDKDTFESDLLRAMIEVEGNLGNRSKNWLACSFWVDFMFKDKGPGNRIKSMIGAEKLVDGKWVDLNPVLIPPIVEYDGK